MKSLIDVQIAVLNDDKPAVTDLLSELDRKTESAMFWRAGEHFGFKTVEAGGRRYAARSQIADVFGYAGESGLRNLADRWGLDAVPMGQFARDVRIEIARVLGLAAGDNKSLLIAWDVFLLAAMQATTPAGDKVKAYLLACERAARIAGGAIDLAKARSLRIADAAKVVSMVKKAETLRDARLRERLLAYVDDLVDGALGLRKTGDLFDANPATVEGKA